MNTANARMANRLLKTGDEITLPKIVNQMELSDSEKELLAALNELK